jgi:D-sedoheptulose 7-phosphate isomerase
MSLHPDRRQTTARAYLDGFKQCLELLSLEQIAEVLVYLEDAYWNGRKVFIVGNGGSAATASHMTADLGKNTFEPHARETARRFRAVPLSDNVAWMSALGNDLGYEHIFSEQLKNLAEPGDLVLVISGSGNSPNIVYAAHTARQIGARVVGFLGFDGGAVRPLLDACILVESTNYGHIEDAHMVLVHLITTYFRNLSRDLPAAERVLELGLTRLPLNYDYQAHATDEIAPRSP